MSGKIRWGAVVRDVVIIWILTGLGGFAVGVTGAPRENLLVGYAVANIIFGTVGFTISGCMAKVGRWKHLFVVAVGVWLVSLVNIFIGPISIADWLFGLVFIVFMMAVGGGLSCLFVRTPKGSESTEAQKKFEETQEEILDDPVHWPGHNKGTEENKG